MRSCAIIISHYESVNFLHAAIVQIRKFAHPEIQQKIFIVDQSSEETYRGILSTYLWSTDVWTVTTKPLYSGYGLDFLFHNGFVDTDYVCQIHADVFPISNQWLYLPIKLIEENNYYFVGQVQFISKKSDTAYPNHNPFFAMAQSFNVARTETYREMSLNAGFTRFHNRHDCGFTFLNDDWGKWAAEDYNARGSDDDVVAFCWEDRHRKHDKLGLAVTGFINHRFGHIIEDLVFHFGSCRESIGVFDSMSPEYKKFTQKIAEGYSDELIEEMIGLAKINKPPQQEIHIRNHWNGETKTSSPISEELNNRIEELKM